MRPISRRRLLAGATGAALATVTVGCSSSGDSDQQGPSGLTFSYLRPTWGPATYTKDGPYELELERQAGVSVDVQIIPVIDYNTKINTILASGDLPDVLWAPGPSSGVWAEAQAEGAFLAIDEQLEKHPAVKAAVPESIWARIKDAEGATYFVPNLIWPQVPFFMFARTDLLESAGIDEPTTLEQFVDTLAAVKKAYPDHIPFTMGYEWHTKELATSFGVSKSGWEPSQGDPNQLDPWFVKEREVDLYFWLQDLHRKGLLDPDYGVNKEPNLSTNKFKANKAVFAIENWAVFPDLVANLKKAAPKGTVGVLDPLGEGAGSRPVFPIDRGFYISAKMADPEAFFDFLEWTLTEGSDFRRYGIEGKTYTVVDGKKAPIQDTDRETAFQTPQLEPLSFIGPFSEKLDWEQLGLSYASAKLDDKFDYIRGKFEAYIGTEYPDFRNPTVLSPTEAADGTRLTQDYLQKVTESCIINHDLSRTDWTTAVEKWKAAGGNKIIDEVNQLQTDKSRPDYTNS
ncbi:extracellular solute-binding protein [Microlunatus sp. GCM10028923]|uniref:extracellular solute-binding protein n=1 Tax=Microlunatus sp. GCM10028923 TaxID=3273400 RepID=UPI00360D7514